MKQFLYSTVTIIMLFISINAEAFSVFVNRNGQFTLNKEITYNWRALSPIKSDADTIMPNAPIYYALKSGYKHGEVYSYMVFDDPKFKTVLVFLKAFTKDILYIYTYNTASEINSNDINRIMRDFYFEKHFSIKNAVDEGVSKAYIMKLTGENSTSRTRIVDNVHGFIYKFSGNMLESATYSDSLSERARDSKGSPTFNRIRQNAERKHKNPSDVIKEINFQFDCIYELPGDSYDMALNGSFNYNFAELYFVIFQNGTFEDFKLCIPDAKFVAKKNGMDIYEYREAMYFFKDGALVNVRLPEKL